MSLTHVIERITAVIEDFKRGLIEVLTNEIDNSATEQLREQNGTCSALNKPTSDENAPILTPLQQQLTKSLDALARLDTSPKRIVAHEQQSTGFSEHRNQHEQHHEHHQQNRVNFSALIESSENESTSSFESDRRKKRPRRRRSNPN